MVETIGKKRFNIDQPSPNPSISVAGSGILILIAGTEVGNPELLDPVLETIDVSDIISDEITESVAWS